MNDNRFLQKLFFCQSFFCRIKYSLVFKHLFL